jgi:hypothetical protein
MIAAFFYIILWMDGWMDDSHFGHKQKNPKK